MENITITIAYKADGDDTPDAGDPHPLPIRITPFPVTSLSVKKTH